MPELDSKTFCEIVISTFRDISEFLKIFVAKAFKTVKNVAQILKRLGVT